MSLTKFVLMKKNTQKVDLQDAHIVFKTSNGTPIFWGYFILDKSHITTSPLFESFRQNMIDAGEKDPLPAILNERCLHLRSWVFDKQLSKKDLRGVILFITNIRENFPYILWCECGDELLCYHIEINSIEQNVVKLMHILEYISHRGIYHSLL